MDIIENLINRVRGFNNELTSGNLIKEIILDDEPFIVDMNAESQLFDEGINRLGVSIMDYEPYSPVTIEIKKAKGQPYNRVTLHDEGDFAASFFIEADDKQFEIKASDFKTEDLVKRYGRQILGLTDENKNVLRWEYVYPDILEQAKKKIYGK